MLDKRRQNFGQVSNSYCRIVNDETGEEIVRYDLGEDYSIETSMVVGELYRNNGEWKFNAIGSGFRVAWRLSVSIMASKPNKKKEALIMPINLSKGQKISLSKEAPGLTHIMVGLGWDNNRYDGNADFRSRRLCIPHGCKRQVHLQR